MKKYKIFIKSLAFVMSIVMILVSTPIYAISSNIIDNVNNKVSELLQETIDTEKTDIDQEVFIVEEDTAKRGQFEKHYLCSDGTYVTVMYPEAIHYLDEDNKWKDVDQSLVYDSSKGVYKSKDTNFGVSFSDKVSSTNMVQIERDGYALSWGIQTTKKQISENAEVSLVRAGANMAADDILVPSSMVSAKPAEKKVVNFEKASERLVSNDDSFVLPNISSQISYTDVFSGTENVSLKYTVYHNKIEEDIIISERGDITSVSMNMDIGSLIPIVNEDGSVDLVNGNYEMQFHIGIPYMVDANNCVCNDIEVMAEKSGTNCIITYTPNSEWFESTERAFPVMLDPSITTNDYVSNMLDTYVEQNSTANHSSEQLLYVTDNGSIQKKAVIRLIRLPQIDASMPIISAELKLTMQNTSVNMIFLDATYYWSGLDFDDYDYLMATDVPLPYISGSYIESGNSTVTFDFTSRINEMYEEEAWCIENGNYSYSGDFIIECGEDSEGINIPPFYSSESTAPDNRPIFSVKYGYMIPVETLHDKIYSFKNVGSGAYMTVNGANAEHGSNIYQAWYGNTASTTQKFKLEYVAATGGYLLKPTIFSAENEKVVAIGQKYDIIEESRNVYLLNRSTSAYQEWLIIPVDYNVFRIVPRSYMSLTLTANGYEDGTNTGNLYTSEGNILVKTPAENDVFQQWLIYDEEENAILCMPEQRAAIETGNYYITNKNNGKYLHYTGRTADCMRGSKSALGESTIKWKVTNLGNGYCTIQRADNPRFYLSSESGVSGSSVNVYGISEESIPEKYQWRITAASGGGCLVQNKASNYYLRALDQSTNPSSVDIYPIVLPSSPNYSKYVWRFANEDYYTELGVGFSFNDISVDVGESISASVNKAPSNATWASYSDFDYTITSGSQYVSYDASTKKFTGIAHGTAVVTATHKVTGYSKTFSITVVYITVVIPCTIAKKAACPEVNSYPISISSYISEYSSHLSGATWQAYENGVINFDSENLTVSGVSSGLAWLEAKKNDETVLICFVYVEDILKSFDPSVQDFLHGKGSFIAKVSIAMHQENPGLDPNVLRVEWYLHAVKLYNQNKSDDEIRQELYQKFGVYSPDIESFGVFMAEVVIGSRGGYSRENLRLSFDGLYYLLDFYWFQYAAYSIATLDTVNVYTPATQQHIDIEEKYARGLCRESRQFHDEVYSIVDDIDCSRKHILTAEERNIAWAGRGYDKPPYKPNSHVVEITLNQDLNLVRVYSNNSPNGSWAMNTDDIANLTAYQIQDKFALQDLPTHICDVKVPKGTTIYVGIVNPNFGKQGLGVQYDFDWQNQAEWFSNYRPLN